MPAAAATKTAPDQATPSGAKQLVNPLREERPQLELLAPLSWPTRASGLRLLYRDVSTNAPLAVKCFDRRDRVKQFVRQEVLTHRRLRHPNLLEFKEVTLSKDYICVLTEHAAAGDLWRYIQKAGRLQEPLARWLFVNYVLGLDYCHKRGVYNINPDCNVLQKLSGFPLPVLKITDFGYSRSLFTDGRQRIAHVGTLAYMAPELLLGIEPYDRRRSDVWSCGILLHLMLYGRFPFDPPPLPAAPSEKHQPQPQPQPQPEPHPMPRPPAPREPEHVRMQSMIARIVKMQWGATPEPPGGAAVSPACRSLLGWMLQADASKRPSLTQLVQHPWFLEGLPADAADLSNQFLDSGMELPGLQTMAQVMAVLQTPVPVPHVPPSAKYDTLVDSLVEQMAAAGREGRAA